MRGSTHEIHKVNGTTRRDIASRLRSILSIHDGASVEDVARRLKVEEVSLRMSIDPDSPYPTVDVLTAVVEQYGLDPDYLLTGTYHVESHRKALGNPGSVADAIRQAAGRIPSAPIAQPPDEPTRIQIA